MFDLTNFLSCVERLTVTFEAVESAIEVVLHDPVDRVLERLDAGEPRNGVVRATAVAREAVDGELLERATVLNLVERSTGVTVTHTREASGPVEGNGAQVAGRIQADRHGILLLAVAPAELAIHHVHHTQTLRLDLGVVDLPVAHRAHARAVARLAHEAHHLVLLDGDVRVQFEHGHVVAVVGALVFLVHEDVANVDRLVGVGGVRVLRRRNHAPLGVAVAERIAGAVHEAVCGGEDVVAAHHGTSTGRTVR